MATTPAPEKPRCVARFAVASGVMRGERVQCLKPARAGSDRCGTHRFPWDRS